MTPGEEASLWVAVLVECVAVAFRLHRLAARPHDGAERAHFGVYLFAALGLTFTITPVYTAFDRPVGVPNLALLLAALLAFVSAWCVQVFYLFVTRPGPVARAELGRRLWLLVGGCALEVALFCLADPHDEVAGVLGFRERYGREPAVVGLGAVIYTWAGLVFWNTALLSRHYARLSRRPMSRLGFYLSVTGALLGIASCVHNELDLVFRSLGWPYPFDPPDAVGNALVAGAVVLLVAGTTMPRWGPRLGLLAALRWLADYRAYVAIHSLWRDLCRAVPEVALEPPADHVVQDLLPPRDLRFRLYRRLVEVLDARLMLRAYVDPRALELAAAGAPLVDWTQDCWWFTFGGWKPVFPSGILTRTVSRDRLEWTIRRRVDGVRRVRLLDQHEALALLPMPGRAGVAGVLIRDRRQADSAATELRADLVVDASGRGSQAPDWLAALGYPRPPETTVNAFLGYASRWYVPPAGWSAGWQVLAMVATPPAGKRGGVIQTIEANQWVVTLAGAARDYPPTDEEGFLAFARSLPSPELYQAIEQAEPISPIRGYRRTENRLRHYERLGRWPAGFLVLGDAVCSLNPVYAQGMTVAALGALALDRMLRRPRLSGARLARRFQRALARAQATPWLLATGEDFRHPTTEGPRPGPTSHLIHQYVDRLQLVATHSPAVHGVLIEVLNLLRPPVGLLTPRLAAQALLAHSRSKHSTRWMSRSRRGSGPTGP